MKHLAIILIAAMAMFSCKKNSESIKTSGSDVTKVSKPQFDNAAISQMVEEPDYEKKNKCI